MADANDNEEASLADDFEEATYDGNDDDSCIVVEDGTEEDDGERVVKVCFSSMVKFHRRNAEIKAHFIKIVQSFVIQNTEFAVRASMLLHAIVMDCVRTQRELPPNFCSRGFISQVVNYTRRPPLLSNELIASLGEDEPFEPPFNFTGRAWLFGYLEIMIIGNILAATQILKIRAVINDSINAYAIIHLRRASRQVTDRIKKEIRRRIYSPGSNPPNNAPQLDDQAMEVVTFHRQGFRLRENQPLTEYYIQQTKGNIRHYILHFGQCLRRQEDLERGWNATHSPKRKIKLKKRFPLPFFTIEKTKSLQIDKKGLYFIIHEFCNSAGILGDNHPPIPGGHNAMNHGLYCEWIKYLFNIKKIMDGSKMFKFSGVGITTNAVSASVHYTKPEWDDTDEDASLQHSIMQHSVLALKRFTPRSKDEDDDTTKDESFNPNNEGNSIHFLLF